MRRVLVDHAKSRTRAKRNAGVRDAGGRRAGGRRIRRSTWTSSPSTMPWRSLAKLEPRLAQVIELHYFGGHDLRRDRRGGLELRRQPCTATSGSRARGCSRKSAAREPMIPRAPLAADPVAFRGTGATSTSASVPPAWPSAAAMTPNCGSRSSRCLPRDASREDPLLNAIGAAAESLLEDHQRSVDRHARRPYRVVSILGHGGMSIVYRGERDDSQYHQTVAIKVLQHATLHPRLRSRLHSERHILATLDHPSIATSDRQRRTRRWHPLPGDGARRRRIDRHLLRHAHPVRA